MKINADPPRLPADRVIRVRVSRLAVCSLILVACTAESRTQQNHLQSLQPSSPNELSAYCTLHARECADFEQAFVNLVQGALPVPFFKLKESPAFTLDSDGTLRKEVHGVQFAGSPTGEVANEAVLFEVNRWTKLPAEPNQLHYQGPCSPTLSCEAVITYMAAGTDPITGGDLVSATGVLTGRL
jgi:hypothetical protein